MNFIKEYAITIASGVVFISLVLMIIPEGSIKKYVKFLLGLILIWIFISPIYSLLNKNADVFSYQSKLNYYFEKPEKSYEDYEKDNIKSTEAAFKENLNKLIGEKLQEKYPDYKFTVNSSITYSSDKKFIIKEVKINYKTNKIKKIGKVGEKQPESREDKIIKNYISEEFKIDNELIYVREG